MDGKKTVFSAIKPTGTPTIGNYLGALRGWQTMQDEYRCIYSVADLHSTTIYIAPAELRKNTLELLSLLLAVGIDPEKSVLFVQSHVPAHAELTWLLNCNTRPTYCFIRPTACLWEKIRCSTSSWRAR